jgi:hypothetical protein
MTRASFRNSGQKAPYRGTRVEPLELAEFAVDARGRFEVHGQTPALTPDEIQALVRFVKSIE